MKTLNSWMAVAVMALGASGDSQAAASSRAHTGGRFALDISGSNAGFLHSVDGGWVSAEVVTLRDGGDPVSRKHIANPRYEELSLAVPINPSKPLGEWITGTVDGTFPDHDGKVVDMDMNGTARTTTTFHNALITEIKLPSMDASSKDAAYMTVKLLPEVAQFELGGIAPAPEPAGQKQKNWQAGNFRLTLGGLNCKHVQKIEALTIKQKLTEFRAGDSRDLEIIPAGLEISDLVVTLGLSSAGDWVKWAQAFIVEGKSSDADEKDGKLELLSADSKTVLAEIEFFGLGLRKFQPYLGGAGESARLVKAEMYCEDIRIKFNH